MRSTTKLPAFSHLSVAHCRLSAHRANRSETTFPPKVASQGRAPQLRAARPHETRGLKTPSHDTPFTQRTPWSGTAPLERWPDTVVASPAWRHDSRRRGRLTRAHQRHDVGIVRRQPGVLLEVRNVAHAGRGAQASVVETRAPSAERTRRTLPAPPARRTARTCSPHASAPTTRAMDAEARTALAAAGASAAA